MKVHLNPDVPAKRARLAAQRGSNAREPIERFLECDEWFIREVEKVLASAERANF